jgi:hypothetical protein
MDIPEGFQPIEAESISAHGSNAQYIVDEFSPFCDPSLISREGEEFIIDRYYGQVYRRPKVQPAAIYGRTMDLPAFSGEEITNLGFLRVPFRRIPRRVVRSRKELEFILGSIRSADDNLKLLLRGQNREHLISRNPATTQWLYGEDCVLEPSLQTSASRRVPALESVLPEWSALIKMFLPRIGPAFDSEAYAFMTHGYFPLFALALAQHYGLATSGLDVTTNLNVALFFALMRYEREPESYKATYKPLDGPDSMPVIYVLMPAKRQQFRYDEFCPKRFPRGRPNAQAAHFMHMGWGYETNAIARYIFLALYLDISADFGPIPSTNDLFPEAGKDAFCGFLEEICDRKIPGQIGQALREGFYSVRS